VPELSVHPAVSNLAAAMRSGGVKVGVGDLLAAHRALAAVDASQREEAFYALRAALCASHADMAVFAEAFALAFAAPDEERDDPLEQLGAIERAAMPRLGIPAEVPETQAEIVRARLPEVPEAVALRVCDAVARLRGEELYKLPGVGETITWARALLALGPDEPLEETLGVALKVREDIDRVRAAGTLSGA